MMKNLNWWALIWFAMGLVFFVAATIFSYDGEIDRSLACLGISLACHARSEIKLLKEENKS